MDKKQLLVAITEAIRLHPNADVETRRELMKECFKCYLNFKVKNK